MKSWAELLEHASLKPYLKNCARHSNPRFMRAAIARESDFKHPFYPV